MLINWFCSKCGSRGYGYPLAGESILEALRIAQRGHHEIKLKLPGGHTARCSDPQLFVQACTESLSLEEAKSLLETGQLSEAEKRPTS